MPRRGSRSDIRLPWHLRLGLSQPPRPADRVAVGYRALPVLFRSTALQRRRPLPNRRSGRPLARWLSGQRRAVTFRHSTVPAQMWQWRARSRCRYGTGEPTPGTDVAAVSPVLVQIYVACQPLTARETAMPKYPKLRRGAGAQPANQTSATDGSFRPAVLAQERCRATMPLLRR